MGETIHPELLEEQEKQKRESIIQRNIEKMNTEMGKLILEESWGGNAGSVVVRGKKYNCAGANAYVAPNGEIKIFSNIQNIPSDLDITDCIRVIFRTRSNSYVENEKFHQGNFRKFPIVNIHYSVRDVGEVSSETKEVLRESVERYNINEAINFEGLYEALEMLGGLQGSERFFPSAKLINLIERVRAGKSSLDYITRRGGLRDKVQELLSKKKSK